MDKKISRCPVCLNKEAKIVDKDCRRFYIVSCPRCGEYQTNAYISKDIKRIFPEKDEQDELRTGLSHYLALADSNSNKSTEVQLFFIDSDFLEKVRSKSQVLIIPNFIQRFEKSIKFFGTYRKKILQDKLDISNIDSNQTIKHRNQLEEAYSCKFQGYVGCPLDIQKPTIESDDKRDLLIQGLNRGYFSREVVNETSDPRISAIKLTLEGWEKYQELLKSEKNSSFGFFASKFDTDSDKIKLAPLLEKFKSDDFIKQNGGFKVYNPLSEEPKAGNITYRMVNEIRDAKFLVAELSHANNGAYWEAGLATGQGKPVFYFCHKKIFESDKKPHFDIIQHHIIVWDEENLNEAINKLADMIKYHFPEGAPFG